MTDLPVHDSALIFALIETGKLTDRERAEAIAPFWSRLTEADDRLSRLRDDPDARGEIETLLLQLRCDADVNPFVREWSRPEVEALAARVLALRDELVTLFDDACALGRAATGGPLDGHAAAMAFALIDLFDRPEFAAAETAAETAAEALLASPGKAGGPGDYTANTRPGPMAVFGAAVVPLFRRAGIPLGGNVNRDKAFAAFLDTSHDFAIGSPIPGRAALLADLRKL